MIKNRTKIYVSVLKTREQRSSRRTNYKYLLKEPCFTSYSAYQTDKGFKEFLKRNEIKMKIVNKEYKSYYVLNKEIEEKLFWNLSQIENLENCKSFTGLSNGSLVTCYVDVHEDYVTIYRPNPNAKKVYKPMNITEHIKYQRIHG